MKILLITVLLTVGFAFCLEDSATEPEKSFSGSVSLSTVSKYLWRGGVSHDNPALQPGLEGSWKDLTAGFWGSVNFGEGEAKGFGEADFYISYDKTLPMNEKLVVLEVLGKQGPCLTMSRP